MILVYAMIVAFFGLASSDLQTLPCRVSLAAVLCAVIAATVGDI